VACDAAAPPRAQFRRAGWAALQSAEASERDRVRVLSMLSHGALTGNEAATTNRADQACFASRRSGVRPLIVHAM